MYFTRIEGGGRFDPPWKLGHVQEAKDGAICGLKHDSVSKRRLRVNKEVKVEEGVESGAENVLVCVEASAVLKAEFYISIVSVPTVVESIKYIPTAG